MTNETIASQLAHRTIRAYKDQPLTEEEVTTLMDVARHTATSSFLQSCTVLHITDPTVREAIGAASGDEATEIVGVPSTRAGALGPVSRPLSSPAGEGTATGITFAASAKGPKGSICFTHPIVE